MIGFTNNVQTVALSRRVDIDNENAQVFGWGQYTITGAETINHLFTVPTTTISDQECLSKHTPRNAQRLTDNKVCAVSGLGRGSCFGDQGGPLIAYIEEAFNPPVPHLIGIVSWHASCAAGYPDVYERISPYLLWIRSYIL